MRLVKNFIYNRSLVNIYFIFIILFWLSIFFLVAESTVGYTVLNIPTKTKNVVFQKLPQGWGFFTKNPREEHLLIYKTELLYPELFSKKNFTLSNFFGISRKNRFLQYKLISKLGNTKKSGWINCNYPSILNCDFETTKIIEVKKDENYLIGEYYLFRGKPIPWAWSKSKINLKNYQYKAIQFCIVDEG